MITGATKSKVDAIWQKMWEGGITNPIEVISQLTYLMFMRSLDEKELETEKMEQMLVTASSPRHTATPTAPRFPATSCAGAVSRTSPRRRCTA